MNKDSDDDLRWWHKAACEGADTELFFPPRDKSLYKKIATQAKKYCFGENGTTPCPVKNICLWEAIETDTQHGIWGGMSHRERNALIRKWQKTKKGKMSLEEFVLTLNIRNK
jgi:WhiB family redox-sensing transcriptional regulator